MKKPSVGRRIIGALLVLLVLPSVAAAQQPRVYAGGDRRCDRIAAVRVTPHFFIVPTFRLLARLPSSSGDPLGDQTRTGPFTFRYGAGVRVTF